MSKPLSAIMKTMAERLFAKPKGDVSPDAAAAALLLSHVAWNRAIGVLVVQKKEVHEYSQTEIEILETVAMVLSEVFSSEEVSNYKKTLIKERGLTARERIKGISLSKGYGLGREAPHPDRAPRAGR